MKQVPYHWYRLTGCSYTSEQRNEIDAVFVYLIQASSKRSVLKYYGGRRTCLKPGREMATVFFPRQESEVYAMPPGWQPDAEAMAAGADASVVIKVIPATRYECPNCGEVRFSDYHYPHMWCNCSHKALPVVAHESPADGYTSL